MFIAAQKELLLRLAPPVPAAVPDTYSDVSKLSLLGRDLPELVRGKTVIDFGCGEGLEAIELVRMGAARVIGVDNRESMLRIGRQAAVSAGVDGRCQFTSCPSMPADVVVSVDSFEHFDDPVAVLSLMHRVLKPGGVVIASWGPPWYHPHGAHLIELPPWTHVMFSERAVIRWRGHMRDDGATRYADVDGGLNQMTIGRFERIVRDSPFSIEWISLNPIRQLRWLHCRPTREFTTSMIQCRLRRSV